MFRASLSNPDRAGAVATLVLYGPDDHNFTKLVLSYVPAWKSRIETATFPPDDPSEKSLHEKWLLARPGSEEWIAKASSRLGAWDVVAVIMPEGVYGCPHEEGEDFPIGADCPECPFWAGKQGSRIGMYRLS